MDKTKEERSSFGVALYYPYINVQDINWLKCSLLYWDKMRRIVPHFVFEHDDELMREFVDVQVLEKTSPDDYREEASNLFSENILGCSRTTPELSCRLQEGYLEKLP